MGSFCNVFRIVFGKLAIAVLGHVNGVVLRVRVKVVGVTVSKEGELAPVLPTPSDTSVQRDTPGLELGSDNEAGMSVTRRAVNEVTTRLNMKVV